MSELEQETEELDFEEEPLEKHTDDSVKITVKGKEVIIPNEILKLLEKYRDKEKMLPEEKTRLFLYLSKLPPRTRLLPLLRKLGFTKGRYISLKSNMSYMRKKIDEARREELAEERLIKIEKKDFSSFVTENWNTLKKLGEKIIIEYTDKAKNRGMSIIDYVTTALEFYEQYADRLDEIDEEIQDLQALVMMFKDAANINFAKLSALRIYMEFQTEILKLKASGIQIPDAILDDFKKKTDLVISSLGVNITHV